MGAAGVAYATVIAQGVSTILAMISLFRIDSCVKLALKDLCFDKAIVKKILKILSYIIAALLGGAGSQALL